MKQLILVPIFLFTGIIVQAQLKGFSIGPYAEHAWPTGTHSEVYKNGLGAGLSADIKLPGKFGLTGSAGYMQFGGLRDKSTGDRADALKAFPVRAGLKFRALPLLYFKVEAGSANYTGNTDGSAFIISPGIGLRLLGIDIQGKYERWNGARDISFWGLRAGLNF